MLFGHFMKSSIWKIKSGLICFTFMDQSKFAMSDTHFGEDTKKSDFDQGKLYGDLTSIWISALYDDPEYVSLRDDILQAFPFHVLTPPDDSYKPKKSRRSSGANFADSLDFELGTSIRSTESSEVDLDQFSQSGLFDWEAILSDPTQVTPLLWALRHNGGEGDTDARRFDMWGACRQAQADSSCLHRESSNAFSCLGRFLRRKVMQKGKYSDCHVSLQSNILYSCAAELGDFCSSSLPFSSQVLCLLSLIEGEHTRVDGGRLDRRWHDEEIDIRFSGEEFRPAAISGVAMSANKRRHDKLQREKKREENGGPRSVGEVRPRKPRPIPPLPYGPNPPPPPPPPPESNPDRVDWYESVVSTNCAAAMATTQWVVSQLESIIKGRYAGAIQRAKNYWQDEEEQRSIVKVSNQKKTDESKTFLEVKSNGIDSLSSRTSAFSKSETIGKGAFEEAGWITSVEKVVKNEGETANMTHLLDRKYLPSVQVGGALYDQILKKQLDQATQSENDANNFSSVVVVGVLLMSAVACTIYFIQREPGKLTSTRFKAPEKEIQRLKKQPTAEEVKR
eukprot:GDKJ01056651.1.p1 GENE.GDKJ01056651.1~~GDKJ01056651.1.p1  ORF type:complete len:563 (-),score=116.46 GDKJ01056651.1:71-1759(-)